MDQGGINDLEAFVRRLVQSSRSDNAVSNKDKANLQSPEDDIAGHVPALDGGNQRVTGTGDGPEREPQRSTSI